MESGLKRILYVEDDEHIALLLSRTFQKLGHFDVKHCASGQEALDAFEDFDPQLVLLDVMMPEMDGCETFAKLRELDGGSNVPIVFMTAKAQTHEQVAYREMGAIGVIVKPVDSNQICQILKDLWARAQAA